MAELAAQPVGMGNLSENERLSYAVQTRLRMIVPYIGAHAWCRTPVKFEQERMRRLFWCSSAKSTTKPSQATG